jgi:hypothetical protein
VKLQLNHRDRRAVLLGAAVVLGSWLVTRGVPALLRAHTEWRARTEASVRQLAAAREALEGAAWTRDSLDARGRRLVAWAPRLVAGGTPAEAMAELQSVISGLAAQHRVRIVRVEPTADSAAGLFTPVRLRVEAQSDVGGLAQWLAAIEEGDHLLSVPRLVISAPEPAASSGQAEVLRAELVIAGWAAPKARRSE